MNRERIEILIKHFEGVTREIDLTSWKTCAACELRVIPEFAHIDFEYNATFGPSFGGGTGMGALYHFLELKGLERYVDVVRIFSYIGYPHKPNAIVAGKEVATKLRQLLVS